MKSIASPTEVAASLTELWSPRVVAEVEDSYVKVAKVHGSLAWHSHENEDELFLILKGHLRIELEDGAVELDEGEMYVVLMLIERKSTPNTGNAVTERTRSVAEQMAKGP